MQDHPRVAQGGSNPSGWNKFSGYSRAKYQEEEVKEQDRRAVEIDQTKRERRRASPDAPAPHRSSHRSSQPLNFAPRRCSRRRSQVARTPSTPTTPSHRVDCMPWGGITSGHSQKVS